MDEYQDQVTWWRVKVWDPDIQRWVSGGDFDSREEAEAAAPAGSYVNRMRGLPE